MTKNEAIKVLKSLRTPITDDRALRDMVDALYMAIEALQTDIVRCSECKFSEVIQNDSSGVMARYCRAFTVPMMRSDDDFCSYGERSEK